MSNLKQQIESLYALAFLDEYTPSDFANKMLELIGADEEKLTRSKLQSRARWRYLTLVARILNDRGHTFDAAGLEIPLKWNKDLLYNIYWQSSRAVMYPQKNKQLNTAEFCKLADHVQDLFAMIFDVHIPFPNIKDKLHEDDAKKL